MKKYSKVYIPPGSSVRTSGPSFNFVFSDDIEKWMHSTGGNARTRKYEEKKKQDDPANHPFNRRLKYRGRGAK